MSDPMAWMFPEPTAEQRAEFDRMKMKSQDLFNRLKRWISEAPIEEVELIHAMFSHVADSGNTAGAANWYTGLLASALFVREVRLGEATDHIVENFGDFE